MAHTELDLRERRAIENMLTAKVPVSKIATEIGRHRSTIYREIKRDGFEDEELPYLNGYYGVNAQRTADARRTDPGARKRRRPALHHLRSAPVAGHTRRDHREQAPERGPRSHQGGIGESRTAAEGQTRQRQERLQEDRTPPARTTFKDGSVL